MTTMMKGLDMTTKTTVIPAAAGMASGTTDAAAGVLTEAAELGSPRSSAPASRHNIAFSDELRVFGPGRTRDSALKKGG
jgi:hypothetical protein